MKEKSDVMLWYCGLTFSLAVACFVLRKLLLRDAANSRISKAADYVLPVEIAAWVFTWYGVSVTMVMVNRWLFSDWQGTGFPFPVLTTMVHMWMKLALSRLLFCCQGRRPAHLDLSVNLRTIIPIGVTTAGDILLSNAALMFATATFYTIVKSGSLMWIMLWAVAFKFEVLTCRMFAVVGFICGGLFLASWKQVDFTLPGMIMILGASCLSGLRWALVQQLQQIAPDCKDPMLVIYYISPSSALAMTPVAFVDIFSEDLRTSQLTPVSIAEVAAAIIWAGMFSFLLILAEVKLLALSSSLTMGVFGTIKEVIQILVAVLLFGDDVTVLKILGLILGIVGSMLYKLTRQGAHVECNPERNNLGDGRHPRPNGLGVNGHSKDGVGAAMPYAAVSQQEVDEELRVFRFSDAGEELEGELEEFTSFDGIS